MEVNSNGRGTRDGEPSTKRRKTSVATPQQEAAVPSTTKAMRTDASTTSNGKSTFSDVSTSERASAHSDTTTSTNGSANSDSTKSGSVSMFPELNFTRCKTKSSNASTTRQIHPRLIQPIPNARSQARQAGKTKLTHAPTMGLAWTGTSSEGLAGQAAITDKDDACSTLWNNNSPDLATHPKAHYKDVVQASNSGPRTSQSLPSLVVKLSVSSSVLKTLEKNMPVNIDTLSRLQIVTASRVRDNEAAKNSAFEKIRLASSDVERATKKVEDVKLQMEQAEKELREARENKADSEGAAEKHNHTAQCYHDFQKDLEQLARMRDEQVKGLQALNVPSSKVILAASMRLMIRGVASKYPDIAGDDAFINAEDSPG